MFTRTTGYYPKITEGETFTFDYGVPEYKCRDAWEQTKPLVDAWARTIGMRYIFETHQRIYIPHAQPDFDNILFQFKMRWC